jgi:hypothetical protein
MPKVGLALDTVRQESAGEAAPVPLAFAARTGGQLKCQPCGKQYNVRGDGNVGVRLIPCPQCGAKLEPTAPQPRVASTADPEWVPIVSVFCKACHGLIDVPYASIGSSIACPRCRADLPVPRIISSGANESLTGQFVHAV